MCSMVLYRGNIAEHRYWQLSKSGQNGLRKGSHLTVCILTTGKLLIRYHT